MYEKFIPFYHHTCLAGYLYTCQTENEEFPSPSSLENISPESVAKDLDFSFEHAFVNMITVDVASYARDNFQNSVKKTLTIPTWLNKLALENNINFSHVLQKALKEKLTVCFNSLNLWWVFQKVDMSILMKQTGNSIHKLPV